MDKSTDLFSSLGPRSEWPRHGHLSHYTDLSAFINIVKTGQLWASNIRFLNDSQEMEFGLKTAKEVFREFLENLPAYAPKVGQRSDPIARTLVPDVYACCFCEEGDMLSQWRGYGLAKQSVSIQFRVGTLQSQINAHKHQLAKVVYGNSEAKRQLREQLNSNGVDFSEWDMLRDHATVKNFNKLRTDTILMNAPRFKHEGFKEEREWRMIITDTESPVQYRAGHNVVIPYKVFDGYEGKLPIVSVIIGPGKDMALTERSVRHFLDKHGYSDVSIEQSKIPFRT